MMKKLLIIGLAIIFIAILAVAIATKQSFFPSQRQITLSETQKHLLRKAFVPLKDFTYTQATLHNPKGDMLPDSIDDTMKQTIKSYITNI